MPENGSTRPAANKTVVVTGAAQGIGFRIAERFAAEGASVIVADLNPAAGVAAAESIGATFTQLDITNSRQIAAVADEVWQRFGTVDVLVNNAGIGHEDDALDVTDELWNRILSVDLTGSFVACREFGRHFVRQGFGAIVNIASVSAFFGNNPEHHIAYDVAKAGVVQMTRSLAVEWAEHGIRVNAVAPGRTQTPILDVVGIENPERIRQWIDQVPQKRILEPTEIAAVVYFLALSDASAITGQTVIADGGHLIF